MFYNKRIVISLCVTSKYFLYLKLAVKHFPIQGADSDWTYTELADNWSHSREIMHFVVFVTSHISSWGYKTVPSIYMSVWVDLWVILWWCTTWLCTIEVVHWMTLIVDHDIVWWWNATSCIDVGITWNFPEFCEGGTQEGYHCQMIKSYRMLRFIIIYIMIGNQWQSMAMNQFS